MLLEVDLIYASPVAGRKTPHAYTLTPTDFNSVRSRFVVLHSRHVNRVKLSETLSQVYMVYIFRRLCFEDDEPGADSGHFRLRAPCLLFTALS